MSQVEARATGSTPTARQVKPPSVLVVLVVHDGAAWLPACLLSLSRQTHPRLGVIAVDNGSTDGSADLLESALGGNRVLRLEQNLGFSTAVGQALRGDVARQADYLLLMHDDAALAPDAVAKMVEAAERVDGVGVVGPKILDWEEPRKLQEIGQSTDRFGFPYSPLEEGEIDQGQYDRIREVLFVSSAAMLVSKGAWSRIGLPDDRFTPHQGDLDYCWRARVAGFRVVMTPQAVARHRAASETGLRTEASGATRQQYERDRLALAAMLKNYGVLSLAWTLPLYLVLGLARVAGLAVTRRFEEASQILAAWGWNVLHLPGTMARRFRVQASRRSPDRVVRRSMAPAGMRLWRWASTMGRTLLPAPRVVDEDAPPVPVRARAASFVMGHPAAAAWALGLVVALLAYRNLWAAAPLTGPALGTMPAAPSDLFRELVSGLRTTGLGGAQAASPALGLLGLGGAVAFGSPPLFQKLLLLVLPAVAGVTAYRAIRSMLGERVPAVVAGALYALSSAVLWAVSEGHLGALVFLAGFPWLATKLTLAFQRDRPVAPPRWIVGAGVGLAVLVAFYPGAAAAAALVALVALALPPSASERGRGLVLTAAAAVVAGALIFPFAIELARGGGAGVADPSGAASFGALLRLSPGPGPGAWVGAYLLPLAALVALVFVPRHLAGAAGRAAVGALAAVYLAWLAAAGYLPLALSNPVAYVGVAAFGYVSLVAMGMVTLMRGVSSVSFGARQIGAGALALLVVAGLGGQIVQAALGSWRVGGSERLPEAYPVVGAEDGPAYRILWVGEEDGDAFGAPGGLPDGTVEAGAASLRFAVRGPEGAAALDLGRPATGPGYRYLRDVLAQMLAGELRHGGAALGPLGIRYLVALEDGIPEPALKRLRRQVDLDAVPTGGLVVFRNAEALPLAAAVSGRPWVRAAQADGPAATAALPPPDAAAFGGVQPVASGTAAGDPGVVLLSQQFDPRWRLQRLGGAVVAEEAVPSFGWGVGFRLPADVRAFEVEFRGQWVRTAQMAVLAVLWVAALWATRRTVRRD